MANSGKTFPVKPKLRSKPRTEKETPESKYWSSFKTHEIPNLISSISTLAFSPLTPRLFSATYSASITTFNADTLSPTSTISSFNDVVTCASFRSDGLLIAAGDLSGRIQIFDVKTRTPLRKLRSHSRPVRFVKYPILDKLHLVSGGDDAIVKYWDVASEKPLMDFQGHKDYVRCGDCSPVSMDMFVTGSYDHTVKLWDVRVEDSRSVMEVNHGKPVESVIFLPSGGLIATAGGNSVKIWDVLGGGKMVCSMESHNKTVTSICVGKIGKEGVEDSQQFRIMSVGLDGYMKIFDYSKMKITHSMRFPAPLMSIGLSPDCKTRVIGTSNGVIYVGKRKSKEKMGDESGAFVEETRRRRALKPTNFRYFHRGQHEKPSEGDFLVMRPKKVKLSEQDKLLKKFRHKEALVSALANKNADNLVAVMEELVARRKLIKSVLNLDKDELGFLLVFLNKYCFISRYSRLLMNLTMKVVELRSEDIKDSDVLLKCVGNIKRGVEEEMGIQQSLQEIQGMISPLLRIAGRR